MNIHLKFLTVAISIAIISYSKTGFSDDDIWATLKQGGNVILMRHSFTDKKGDPLLLKMDDCSVQRNLSEKGQMHAKAIRKKFFEKSIPIDSVLSSRYCRAQETAKLTFNKVELWEPLDLLLSLPENERTKLTNTVSKRISSYKGKGNLVMVTHRPNIEALTYEAVGYGEFLVLKPDVTGENEFEIVEQ